MNITKKIRISASAKTIWPLLTELEQMQKWNKSLLSAKAISEGEICEGYKSKIMVKEGSKEVEYDEEIVVFEHPSKIEFRMSGGNLGRNPMQIKYELEPGGDGTLLSVESRWKPGGVFLVLMSPIVNRISAKSLDKQLIDIKRIAEHQ